TPSAAHAGNHKTQRKTFFKSVFKAKYNQAILNLEAEAKLLCLCSGHWKADCMLGQAFSWRSDTEARAVPNRAGTTSSKHKPSNAMDLQLLEPPITRIPQTG